MRTIVYVDGFNLYYGSLRPTLQRPGDYRWLDLGVFCARLLPNDQIMRIKYFTALVESAPWKSGQAKRSAAQETYIRALRTVPNLTVHYGHFLSHPVKRRLVDPPPTGSPYRDVWHTEEKGSDVNLASHLLIDGFRGNYELAVIISNDGDLKEPAHVVRHDLTIPVGVLNPHPNRSWALSPALLPSGCFYKPIRQGAAQASLFPAALTDAAGSFASPPGWATWTAPRTRWDRPKAAPHPSPNRPGGYIPTLYRPSGRMSLHEQTLAGPCGSRRDCSPRTSPVSYGAACGACRYDGFRLREAHQPSLTGIVPTMTVNWMRQARHFHSRPLVACD